MQKGRTRVPFPGLQAETTEIDGLEFQVKGLPTTRKILRHLRRGDYENPEREMVKNHLKPGDQVLELGGSLGIVASFIKRQIGPEGRLLSVEANSDLLPFYHRQLALNGYGEGECVHALCCPIWKSELPTSMALKVFVPSPDNRMGSADTFCADAREVGWITAEAVCTEHNMEPDALVLDIVGAEGIWAVSRPNFPPCLRTIICEFHHHRTGMETAGSALQAVLDEGFKVAAICNNVLTFTREGQPGSSMRDNDIL